MGRPQNADVRGKKIKIIISTLALLLIGSTAYATENIATSSAPVTEPKAFIVSYGTYTQIQEESSELVDAGVLNTGVLSQKLLDQAETIRAQLGTVIGFEFMLSGNTTNPQEILTFVTTPPKAVLNPDTGETAQSITFSRTIEHTRRNPFLGYRFEKAWECISGIWLFQVRYKDMVIVEKQFTVNFDQ